MISPQPGCTPAFGCHTQHAVRISVLKNYDAGPPVEFRGVRLRAVAAQEGCGNVG
ncbi:hypothetical protein SAMN04487914_10526 [Arthrobacter sp. ok909]|nr:hypothetical protein SAMN04487914_10526 [Arthrobacter sp. ok909]